MLSCAGGGAPEIEVSRQLGIWSRSLHGMESYCVRAFANAMEVILFSWIRLSIFSFYRIWVYDVLCGLTVKSHVFSF